MKTKARRLLMLLVLSMLTAAVIIGCAMPSYLSSSSQGYMPSDASAVSAPYADQAAMERIHIRQADEDWNREAYDHIVDNPFMAVADNPLSTFSIDVDTASYSNMRRILNAGRLPPAGAVRIEEGEDPNGYRAEFIQLAKLATDLMPVADASE